MSSSWMLSELGDVSDSFLLFTGQVYTPLIQDNITQHSDMFAKHTG